MILIFRLEVDFPPVSSWRYRWERYISTDQSYIFDGIDEIDDEVVIGECSSNKFTFGIMIVFDS